MFSTKLEVKIPAAPAIYNSNANPGINRFFLKAPNLEKKLTNINTSLLFISLELSSIRHIEPIFATFK